MKDVLTKAAAVFLDRDGTLVRDIGYLCAEDQLEVLPRVPQAIRLLRTRSFRIVVVTNQSAVARGRLTESELQRIHAGLSERLGKCGAPLDGIYYCPHHPTEGVGAYNIICDCRKPKPGLIRRAAAELGLDPAISYVVGDQLTDMELAERVGARGIWIGDRQSLDREFEAPKVHVVADLWQAARLIVDDLEQMRGRES